MRDWSAARQGSFESSSRTDTRNDNEIRSDDMMRKYLDGVTAATTANTERMQKMANVNISKDDQLEEIDNQLVEMMVRLDTKNTKVEDLIARLTALNGGGSGGSSRIKANQQNHDKMEKSKLRRRQRPNCLSNSRPSNKMNRGVGDLLNEGGTVFF